VALRAAAPKLLQLVYVSRWTRDLTAELDQMEAEFTRASIAAGLTGLMLHQGDSFYGILEGTERRLLARMERVISDGRVKDVRVLREEVVASRRFENLSFAALPPRPQGSPSAERFVLDIARRLHDR
jgi:hypothetical protein